MGQPVPEAAMPVLPPAIGAQQRGAATRLRVSRNLRVQRRHVTGQVGHLGKLQFGACGRVIGWQDIARGQVDGGRAQATGPRKSSVFTW